MKKIMFDDKFGLTKAVLEGRKTMTRRIVKHPEEVEIGGHKYLQTEKLPFKVGEVVAVAQAYKDTWGNPDFLFGDKPGWSNKMFVAADLMPHQIRITGLRVERLQDISDEDCIMEGIEEDHPYYWVPINMNLPNWRKLNEAVSDIYPNNDGKVYTHFWDSPRKAFAALIKKLYGNKTWNDNPYVFVYTFELQR